MKNIIKVNNLVKAYGKNPAIRGISFDVKEGQMLALLGPNGAGKSTTMDILSTFTKADAGKVTMDGFVMGQYDNEIRKRIGAVFQEGLLDDLLTVEENLYLRGRLYGLRGKQLQKNIEATAEVTGIRELRKRPYGQLSGGQRRRCDIARALLNTPKILFLDEPTTGLDPQMRNQVWETICNIQQQTGMTILLTTHYMEEAVLADDIIIMKDGLIAACGSPTELKDNFAKDRLNIFASDIGLLKTILHNKRIPYKQHGATIEIPLSTTTDALPILDCCRGRYTSFEVVKASMDDVYLSIITEEHHV
ncbi:MAG: ABC transporter ATP-binding protein [Angelakisella sp.]|nr:ABC transporter ATP-binding protein [Angelakisella sp.]